jgi:ribonuclease P protein component
MLPLKYRLTKKKDFENVFKKGKGFKQDLLFLKAAKNDLGENRFGFVVSTKISKKATERNKVKRRLREAVWQRIGELKKGTDAVFVALPGIEGKNYDEISLMVEKLLAKEKKLMDSR